MRILLADDHSIIRAALSAVIATIDPAADIHETDNFDGLTQAIDAIRQPNSPGPFDLVVLDLRMPGFRDSAQIAQVVLEAAPTPVVVFSMSEDRSEILRLIELGIRAYVPKSTDHAVLSGILRIVLAGGIYVPPLLVVQTAAGSPSEAGPPSLAPVLPTPTTVLNSLPALSTLTPRQREVMTLLGDGLSNNEICDRLGLNLSTVKAHVSSVLRALDAESRTQAALKIRQMLNSGPAQ